MLKKLTKSGEYTHLFIIAVALGFYFFTHSVDFAGSETFIFSDAAPIGNSISKGLAGLDLLTGLINTVLILIISIYVKSISTSSEITPRQSYIAASLAAVFMLFSPHKELFTGPLVVILLLTFSLGNIMKLFGRQFPYLQVLNAAMAVAVSSMILPYTAIYMLFIWFGFFTYSVNSWREWVISLVGFVIPYLYMLFGFLWYDNLSYLYSQYSIYFSNLSLRFNNLTTSQVASLLMILIILVSALLHFTSEASDKVISIRKKMWLTFQFTFISFIVILLSGEFFYLLLPVLYVPLTLMLSYSVHNRKRSRLYDVAFFLFIITIILNRVVF